jgi:integrase
LIYSLGTKNRHDAFLKALKINLHFEEWVSKMSNNDKRFPALLVELGNGAKVDFDMTVPAEKEAYYDLLENIGKIRPTEVKPAPATIVGKRFTLENELAEFKKLKVKLYAKATFTSYVARIQQFINYAKANERHYVDDIDIDFAKEYREHLNGPKVSLLTVDNHTKAIKQYFDLVIRNKHFDAENPFAGLHLVKKSQIEAVTDSYIPFRPEELTRLFDYPIYVKRFNKPDLFYSPLMALLMGFRLEELAQLRVSDVYEIDGIWVININDNGPDKKLKTPSAARILPLHQSILSTNFLEYHQYIREAYGDTSLLYPYLIKTKNGYGKNIGYNFTKYKKKHIQIDPTIKAFHSLRKNFGNFMTDKGFDLTFRKYVIGHSNTDITDIIYGAKTPKEMIRDMLNELVYPQINFAAFQFDFRKNNMIERLVRAKKMKMLKAIS